MDSTTIGTAANLTTTLIVAVTSFAALRQMRHNHTANELQLHLHLHFVNEVNSPEMRGAMEWTQAFAERMKDPGFRELLLHDPQHESLRDFFRIMRFFERYASLVIAMRAFEHLAMRAKKYRMERSSRDYARLERDPRVVELEAAALTPNPREVG